MKLKKTNLLITFILAISLFLNSSIALARWYPPVSVTTYPVTSNIGEPSVTVTVNYVNIKWCGVPELSSPTIVIRQDPRDGEAAGTVPIEIISLELKSVEPINVAYRNSSTELSTGQIWPVDSWKENKEAKTLNDILSSSWQLVPGHMGISYGWPADSAKLPAEANGLQIIHKASSWSFLPVGDDDGDKKSSSVRLSLTSKPGEKESFGIFLPQALLGKWGISSKNVAAVVDGDRVAATVNKNSNPQGLMVNFSFTYPISVVSVGKAMPLSLSANKKSIKGGKLVKLYGWVNPKRKGAKVKVLRKLKGKSAYEEVAAANTNSSGYYKYSDKPSRTAFYKAVMSRGAKRITSKVKKVIVK
jgi:hypothetical protein